jgi:hypothetical protein
MQFILTQEELDKLRSENKRVMLEFSNEVRLLFNTGVRSRIQTNFIGPKGFDVIEGESAADALKYAQPQSPLHLERLRRELWLRHEELIRKYSELESKYGINV